MADGNAASDNIKRDGNKQGEYYSKWDKFAKTSDKELDEVEKQEKKDNEKALGIDHDAPKTEQQKADLDKHHALKEAKKMWQEKIALEEGAKKSFDSLTDQTITVDPSDLKDKLVLNFHDNTGCTFALPETVKVVKVFVANCNNCTFNFKCQILTSNVEISHCDNLTINVQTPIATIQADLCDTVKVVYSQNCMRQADDQSKGAAAFPGDRIYHAAVKNLTVVQTIDHARTETATSDYRTDAVGSIAATPENQQFVTLLVAGKIATESVKRVGGGVHPVTERELAESGKGKGNTADDIEEQRSAFRQAEAFKGDGNGCFKELEYAQAAVHYTQAIVQADMADREGTVETQDGVEAEFFAGCKKLRYVCFSNRSACFLKLGQPEKAEPDARKCAKINPKYCKGQFRLGLALHALERYGEAVQVLSTALDIEPKNKQIKVAIGFAEMKARKQHMERFKA